MGNRAEFRGGEGLGCGQTLWRNPVSTPQSFYSICPRIASKVFLNLTRILSDRLERMTNHVVGLRKAS